MEPTYARVVRALSEGIVFLPALVANPSVGTCISCSLQRGLNFEFVDPLLRLTMMDDRCWGTIASLSVFPCVCMY